MSARECDHAVTWHEHDTRGYIDGGPSCDECGACECDPCETHGGNGPACRCEDCDEAAHVAEDCCIGLSHAWCCLDGGETYCDECAPELARCEDCGAWVEVQS